MSVVIVVLVFLYIIMFNYSFSFIIIVTDATIFMDFFIIEKITLVPADLSPWTSR